MSSGLREKVLKELNESEVLHMRELIRRLDISISTLKPLLAEMVEQGLVEKFSHGGYTFYRITSEGRGYLMQMHAESVEVSEADEEKLKAKESDEGEKDVNASS